MLEIKASGGIKDIDTACKYLDYAIEIAPNDAEAYNVYGNIHFDKKEKGDKKWQRNRNLLEVRHSATEQ